MYRPLDKRLHFSTDQNLGEYFGKDCGKLSLPRGQGSSVGTLSTADDVYPCIVPYKARQSVDLNKGYTPPKKGERPMHATTIQYAPVKPVFTSTTRHDFGGRKDLRPVTRPHACRSMHQSQIIFGRDMNLERSTTYAGTFEDKYSQPHYKILEPLLNNKVKSADSRDVRDGMRNQPHTRSMSQYGVTHNKLGAMLEISKPKYEIPIARELPRHYNVLTGEDIGPSWQPENKRISGNRTLHSALQAEKSFVLC